MARLTHLSDPQCRKINNSRNLNIKYAKAVDLNGCLFLCYAFWPYASK